MYNKPGHKYRTHHQVLCAYVKGTVGQGWRLHCWHFPAVKFGTNGWVGGRAVIRRRLAEEELGDARGFFIVLSATQEPTPRLICVPYRTAASSPALFMSVDAGRWGMMYYDRYFVRARPPFLSKTPTLSKTCRGGIRGGFALLVIHHYGRLYSPDFAFTALKRNFKYFIFCAVVSEIMELLSTVG